jgi:transposase-like protein
MSIKCKSCESLEVVKSGIVSGKQRYECKKCNRNFRVGDDREKYTENDRLKIIKLYLENVGIRSIERLTGVSSRMVIYWIRKFSNIIKDKLNNDLEKLEGKKENIEILEIDEMFSYLKKNLKIDSEEMDDTTKETKKNISFYGLLSTGKQTKLLILK